MGDEWWLEKENAALIKENKAFRAVLEEALGFVCSATPEHPECICSGADTLWHEDAWELLKFK